MCSFCDRGIPHQCRESGAFEMGRSSFQTSSARYREDPPALLGQPINRRADPEIGESPLDAHSIRTSDGHLISVDPHLPTHANLKGLSHDMDPELLAEVEDLMNPPGMSSN